MDENNAHRLSFLLRNGQSLSRDFSSACIRHKEKVQDNFIIQYFMNDDLENLPQAICLKLCLAGRPRAAHLLLHEVSNFFVLVYQLHSQRGDQVSHCTETIRFLPIKGHLSVFTRR